MLIKITPIRTSLSKYTVMRVMIFWRDVIMGLTKYMVEKGMI